MTNQAWRYDPGLATSRRLQCLPYCPVVGWIKAQRFRRCLTWFPEARPVPITGLPNTILVPVSIPRFGNPGKKADGDPWHRRHGGADKRPGQHVAQSGAAGDRARKAAAESPPAETIPTPRAEKSEAQRHRPRLRQDSPRLYPGEGQGAEAAATGDAPPAKAAPGDGSQVPVPDKRPAPPPEEAIPSPEKLPAKPPFLPTPPANPTAAVTGNSMPPVIIASWESDSTCPLARSKPRHSAKIRPGHPRPSRQPSSRTPCPAIALTWRHILTTNRLRRLKCCQTRDSEGSPNLGNLPIDAGTQATADFRGQKYDRTPGCLG